MTCNDIQNMTVPYLELDLDPDRVHQVTEHLEVCLGCRSEMESVRQVLVRLNGRVVPDPGERFWNEFPPKVRHGLLHARTEATKSRPTVQRLFSRPLLPAWSWALAASVILLLGAWLFVGGQFLGKSGGDLLTKGGPAIKSPATNSAHGLDLADVAEVDWDRTWDEDDSDIMLADMAAQLDPRILDR